MPVRAFIGLHALEPYDPDPGSDILIGGATPVRGTCPCGPEHARPVATGYPDRPAAWDRDLLRRSASWNRSRAMGSAGRADRRGRGRGRGCAGGGGAGESDEREEGSKEGIEGSEGGKERERESEGEGACADWSAASLTSLVARSGSLYNPRLARRTASATTSVAAPCGGGVAGALWEMASRREGAQE
ncbi:hypothetical protein AXG93_702s1260 [Marchantia polymorpha subsp. ruderalis]|uniref:Uncharacterized protein n=1 Tax=Marchantia polymorpha subsp. ruderalis TaxID=1480154 RepID=A0A176WB10_MARPO|nr:hypothetical protein AXG93_702s1260 [Marchantia polymorpha subsp. ruderalis]